MGLNVKYLLFLSDFNNCLLFSTNISKTTSNKFNKTHPMPEEFFHADTEIDGRTDRQNDANSLFSQDFLRNNYYYPFVILFRVWLYC